jgi:putative FmdB family regulatory protein
MPLYEYECDACGRRFEEIQKFSDPAIKACPTCGGTVQKLPSTPAIQFKGSGWYITDYARKGQTRDNGGSGSDKDKKDKKDDKHAKDGAGSSETKAASATDGSSASAKSPPASDRSSSSSSGPVTPPGSSSDS